MRTKVARYLEKASYCRLKAESSPNKDTWLAVADRWERLAQGVEGHLLAANVLEDGAGALERREATASFGARIKLPPKRDPSARLTPRPLTSLGSRADPTG
jgi:hypothetical protein